MLTPNDITGFFASRSQLNAPDYVELVYRFETAEEPRQAAAALCCEQSTAQWQRPGHDEDFRENHGAKVVSLQTLATNRYEVHIWHPHRNFGPRLPNFLSAAAGEGPFYCPGIRVIKWMDFSLPDSFQQQFSGPRFGLEGVRSQLDVFGRPIFIGVVKPNIGLAPADFAEIAYQGWRGGLDITKDDEMLADTQWSPVLERVRCVSQARQRAEQESGAKKIFIANITDEVTEIPRLHDAVTQAGANAVMINSVFTGVSSLRGLCQQAQVPVTSHFTGTSVVSRMPDFGISSLVMTKLQRLAGADIIVLAGFGERMGCSDEEVLANVNACLSDWGRLAPSLPVPGGSDSAETLPAVFERIGHPEFGFICGRGVFGHPEGPAAGAQSLHAAWQTLDR